MVRYIQRRLLIMIPVLWGIVTLVFFFMYMLPGDPASAILAQSGGKAENIAQLREQLGLDDPLPVQYFRFLSNAVRGISANRFSCTGRFQLSWRKISGHPWNLPWGGWRSPWLSDSRPGFWPL